MKKERKEPMTLQNEFDLVKKQFEGGDLDAGFLANGRLYNAYHTKDEWNAFLEDMKTKYQEAYDAYEKGDGGELVERCYPPKMASYGSSSRFIFDLFKDVPGFQFEKKLGICVFHQGREAKASLDGYLEDKCIYVEAKCREIYSKSRSTFNVKYGEFYEFLANGTNNLFEHDVNGKYNRFSWGGASILRFDFKQLLCHLLGIAKQAVLDKGERTPKLLYLVYDPAVLDRSKDKMSAETNETIRKCRKCWEDEKKEVEAIDVPLLYKHTVNFLHERKRIGDDDDLHLPSECIERISNSFVFQFCSQKDYLACL